MKTILRLIEYNSVNMLFINMYILMYILDFKIMIQNVYSLILHTTYTSIDKTEY